MFDSKDLLVTLVAAEGKYQELKEEHKKQYDALYEEFAKFINETKEATGVVGEGEFKDLKLRIPIGHNTGLVINGINVYTGDEIRLNTKDTHLNGKLAIVTIKNGKPYWHTNSESNYFDESMEFKITRHFVQYKDSEEVAVGRKGAKGFTVHLNKK